MNIGKDVFIAAGVIFDLEFPKLITIKDGAIVGTLTKILTHEVTFKHIRIGRVAIGKQALIGSGALIRSGTEIGDRAAVGMGALVLEDVLPKVLVVGVPAKKIKDLKELL
jgi:acetyltransferase-like isoleucine patch superfamily enzyme